MKRSVFVGLICVLAICDPSAAQVGGVKVDADGVLRELPRVSIVSDREPTGEQVPHRRLVSLSVLASRLQSALGESGGAETEWPDEVRTVGGLVRIEGVVFATQPHDVLLIGEWDEPDGRGSRRGRRTGRPFVAVDDLVHALRFSFAEDPPDGFIGCSIDPTPEGVRRYQAMLSRLSRQFSRSQAAPVLSALKEAIGPQTISVFGVPGESRFALKLVAADYRLKRIAMGLDPSPLADIPSYIDLLAAQRSARRIAQHRWWFEPSYEAIECDAARELFLLRGPGVGVSVDRATPGRQDSPAQQSKDSSSASAAAQQFATRMTRHFPVAAARVEVFAELQNLVALCMVSEIIASRAFDDGYSEWTPRQLLADELVGQLPSGTVPRSVAPIAGVRRLDAGSWLVSFSGGIEINGREIAGSKRWSDGRSDEFQGVAAAVRRVRGESGFAARLVHDLPLAALVERE